MAAWKNLDTLASYGELSKLKNHVDIAKAMSGENGAERVAKYSVPMAAGLAYNYAAKQLDYATITLQKRLTRLFLPLLKSWLTRLSFLKNLRSFTTVPLSTLEKTVWFFITLLVYSLERLLLQTALTSASFM